MLDYLKNSKKKDLLLIIIAILLIAAVSLIRYAHYNSAPIGYEPYFHQRMAEEIISLTNLLHNPFHWMIAFLQLMIGAGLTNLLLPPIIGLIALGLLLTLLNELGFDVSERFYTGLFFVLSPIYILLSAALNVHMFTLMLFLQGILSLMRRETKLPIILFSIAALSSFYAGAAISLFLAAYYLKQKDISLLKTAALLIILAGIGRQFMPVVRFSPNLLTELVGDLGGLMGFNIYTLLLFGIGFILCWRFKTRLAFFYVYMAGILAMALFSNAGLNIYLLIPICAFAANGFIFLSEREWKSQFIRDLTLLILITGLVVSGITYVKQAGNALPDEQMYDSLITLKNYAKSSEKVFSYYDRSEWIKSVSGMDTINDFENQNEQQTQDILLSRNFNKVIEYFKTNDIIYIWIDRDLRERFWADRDSGLIFFLQNKQYFEKIYESDSVELWKFNEEESVE